jgi:hypothetical protein
MPGFQLAVPVMAFVPFVCSVAKLRFCPAFTPSFTAPRRRTNDVTCVPTFESSLTPAGAAAVDRARTPLDRHHLLSQRSCARCIEL